MQAKKNMCQKIFDISVGSCETRKSVWKCNTSSCLVTSSKLLKKNIDFLAFHRFSPMAYIAVYKKYNKFYCKTTFDEWINEYDECFGIWNGMERVAFVRWCYVVKIELSKKADNNDDNKTRHETFVHRKSGDIYTMSEQSKL